jgi:hypothetical protein
MKDPAVVGTVCGTVCGVIDCTALNVSSPIPARKRRKVREVIIVAGILVEVIIAEVEEVNIVDGGFIVAVAEVEEDILLNVMLDFRLLQNVTSDAAIGTV